MSKQGNKLSTKDQILFLQSEIGVLQDEIQELYNSVKDFSSADYTKTKIVISGIEAKKKKLNTFCTKLETMKAKQKKDNSIKY
jgi:predicted ATP-grasp superfamily ATP-dependent carboligase